MVPVSTLLPYLACAKRREHRRGGRECAGRGGCTACSGPHTGGCGSAAIIEGAPSVAHGGAVRSLQQVAGQCHGGRCARATGDDLVIRAAGGAVSRAVRGSIKITRRRSIGGRRRGAIHIRVCADRHSPPSRIDTTSWTDCSTVRGSIQVTYLKYSCRSSSTTLVHICTAR